MVDDVLNCGANLFFAVFMLVFVVGILAIYAVAFVIGWPIYIILRLTTPRNAE